MQEMDCAFVFVLLRAGNSRLASIAMMAMTTSSSMGVNPICDFRFAIFDFIRVLPLQESLCAFISVLWCLAGFSLLNLSEGRRRPKPDVRVSAATGEKASIPCESDAGDDACVFFQG